MRVSARRDGGTSELLLLAVAYDFAPDCEDRYGRVRVAKIRPHRDLQIGDLKPEAAHQAFVMVGQPEIAVHDEDPDPAAPDVQRISVEVLGYDIYNPATGTVESSAGAAKVACFMVDTDHDSMNFYARRIHFPGADDRQIKTLRRTLGSSVDDAQWDAALSSRSAPFARPAGGVIAAKIITADGGEMTVVRSVGRAD